MKAHKKNPTHKYADTLPVDVYILAKQGLPNIAIAKTLHVTINTFTGWTKDKPAIIHALKMARSGKGGSVETFEEYVYKQLSPDMQQLWDDIMLWEDHSSGVQRIEELLSKRSRKVRQSLWVHAMIHYSFNASDACRVLNIPKATLDMWIRDDPEFPALVDQVKWHKKNFFETGLVKLAEEGNTLAIMMANKTLNADRGYSEKISVEHSGTVIHAHIPIPLDKLDLDVETLLKIEEAMKRLPQQAEPIQLPA